MRLQHKICGESEQSDAALQRAMRPLMQVCDDLLYGEPRLAAEGRFDYLLIESTAISELFSVAATFDFPDEFDDGLYDVSRFCMMVKSPRQASGPTHANTPSVKG